MSVFRRSGSPGQKIICERGIPVIEISLHLELNTRSEAFPRQAPRPPA